MNRFDYHGSHWFPVAPEQMWQTVGHFERFESWWGWLRELSADGDGLVAGTVLHGVVLPPVPYRLRLDVRLTTCEPMRLVEASIGGDLRGHVRLRLAGVDGGTRVTAVWSVEMVSAPLRLAAYAAYPLMRWGHDRVVDMAVAGFRRNALAVTAAR